MNRACDPRRLCLKALCRPGPSHTRQKAIESRLTAVVEISCVSHRIIREHSQLLSQAPSIEEHHYKQIVRVGLEKQHKLHIYTTMQA